MEELFRDYWWLIFPIFGMFMAVLDIQVVATSLPTIQAALDTPSAVAVAANGDIYIADTLNYRVRMIDAKTGLIHTVAGDGSPGDIADVGDNGPAELAHLNMPSDVQLDPQNGDIYIADMHHNRIRKVDAKTRIITTVAGTGEFGYSGDDGPATNAKLAGAAGIALVPEGPGRVIIFIADYYNGHVRAVGTDGGRDPDRQIALTFGFLVRKDQLIADEGGRRLGPGFAGVGGRDLPVVAGQRLDVEILAEILEVQLVGVLTDGDGDEQRRGQR